MYNMIKNLYCIRHGYALHNKLFWDIGNKAYEDYFDTPLLKKGYSQAKILNKNWKEKNKIELVIVSPCSRTLDTAKFVFKDTNVPMIAKDFLIEFPLGGREICNKRKNITDLKFMYPNISFESNTDELEWSTEDESIEELEKRIKKMTNWIGKRKERNIAIVSHSSFIGQFKDKKIGDELNELKHCYPYEIKINFNKEGEFISMNEMIKRKL